MCRLSLSCSPSLSSSHHSYVGGTSPKQLLPGVLSARSRLPTALPRCILHFFTRPTALSPTPSSLSSTIFLLRRDVTLLSSLSSTPRVLYLSLLLTVPTFALLMPTVDWPTFMVHDNVVRHVDRVYAVWSLPLGGQTSLRKTCRIRSVCIFSLSRFVLS